ncbi:MAG TPA: bifunctional heptose 7-phosphate kinase/heptose 1-phosphate adenyltransferase [Phycisphaerales bacterium]|nr:bifunctional heptose 7-phosphate kinase/heptose 1-phosphate adenyltransferase [Phycisphaerales bacterium]
MPDSSNHSRKPAADARGSRPSLLETLASWRGFTAIVVGDFMLDRLTFGNADRLSPEAPVPVLHVQKTEHRAGGASNVCLNLAAMRARVHALGVIGDDEDGRTLRACLAKDAAVDASGLVVDASRPTTLKQSLIGLAQHRHAQKMFRLDVESREPISPAIERAIWSRFEQLLPDADVVLIEDYNKGVCTPELCQRIIRACRERSEKTGRRIECLIDPAAIKDYAKYAGATTITPNRSEAVTAAGASLPHDSKPESYEPAARSLQRALGLDSVVIKLDKHGALLLEPREGSGGKGRGGGGDGAFEARHVPTIARQVYDVTGAGDMVLAALAAGRANGLDWFDSTRLANVAAGLEVEVFGVAPIPLEQIHRECLRLEEPGHARKVRTLDEVLVEVAAARHAGRTIIFTNGCFDILHAGHLSLLRRAAELGPRPFLVVAINTDASVKRLKGHKDPSRPINNELDRAELLGGIECVSAVIHFDDDTPERVIRAIRPDVLVKGDEYSIDQVPGAKFVQETGGRVELLPMITGKSTTGIVEKMRRVESR